MAAPGWWKQILAFRIYACFQVSNEQIRPSSSELSAKTNRVKWAVKRTQRNWKDGKPAMKMSCQIRGCIMLHMYALHHTIPRSNWPFLMTEDCQSTSHLQVVTRPPYLFDVWCHKKGNLNVEARTNPMVTELLLICVKIPTGEATRLFGLGPIDQRW